MISQKLQILSIGMYLFIAIKNMMTSFIYWLNGMGRNKFVRVMINIILKNFTNSKILLLFLFFVSKIVII